jgi:hypothetical protein
MKSLRLLLPLLLAACVGESDLDIASQEQGLSTTPKIASLFAERGTRVVPVALRDLSPQERQSVDSAAAAAGSGQSASISCTSGGGCNSQGCWSWAICHGGGVVAVANCTSSGCTVDTYE